MYIPEWEIEELLVHNPELIGFPSAKLRLIERQKYLVNSGRYIDLLFKKENVYLIVEIKSVLIKDKAIVTNQVLPYREHLAEELNIPKEEIKCMLITPNGFSKEVEEFCKKMGIITKTLDHNALVSGIRKLNSVQNQFNAVFTKTINGNKLDSSEYSDSQDVAKRQLAKLFLRISRNAPIQAHEVGTISKGELTTNRDMWFWLFYSVMDRRSNASTFVKAKEALEIEGIFDPHKITELVQTKGEEKALIEISRILKKSNFPLLVDKFKGNLAFPKSIIDAAKFMRQYKYDFNKLYTEYIETYSNNLRDARDHMWQDLQKKIYGAGPRIASQIIRGLVLKGPWEFPLDDDRFLEKCKFNIWIASETRLDLISEKNKYYEQLGEFADKYLDGNRGIIAHVLWYTRKLYCNRPPKCDECKVSDYCNSPYISKNKKISDWM
jgi:hypothetical protein